MTSPSCEENPDQPKCVRERMLKKLTKINGSLSQSIIEIETDTRLWENPQPLRGNRFSRVEASGNMRLPENGDTGNESFSDFDTVIKEKSANLSEVIVDLIITNQVGDNPERIRGIRLKIARFVKDLKAMEIADIKPEIKKEISDRMKASMSAILEEILTH
ncbi:hypothetical protein [Microcoleus sp. Pol10D4]|uniref:hypothetical protein n=1 Tax=Microcoleus sp. Pol10D4 TaxID=3055387 RepID=UPI002FCE6EA4